MEINVVVFFVGFFKNLVLVYIEIVVYDRIFINVGIGYDFNIGKFRCLISGVYVF